MTKLPEIKEAISKNQRGYARGGSRIQLDATKISSQVLNNISQRTDKNRNLNSYLDDYSQRVENDQAMMIDDRLVNKNNVSITSMSQSH